MTTVSDRVLAFVKDSCQRTGIDYAELVGDLEGLSSKAQRGRVQWSPLAIALERLEERLGGPSALEEQGAFFNEVSALAPLRALASGFVSARLIYRAVATWIGPSLVPWMQTTYEERGDGSVRIVMEIPEPLRHCAQFFRYTLGAYRSAPRMLGQGDAMVDAEIGPRRAVYVIVPPPDLTLLARLRRGLGALRGPSVALAELAKQQGELSSSHVRQLRARIDLERVLDHLPTSVFILLDESLVYANPAALRSLGLDHQTSADMPRLLDLVDPEQREALGTWLRSAGNGGTQTFKFAALGGEPVYLEVSRPQTLPFGGESAQLLAAHDVTEARALEEQFRQSQKMEAVGRLAGGVAHDFNNLLSVILSYSTLMIEDLPAEDPVRDDLTQILRAGERAAALTGQLLAFSRRQLMQPKVLDLNEVLTSMDRLMRRLIGEHIELVTVLEPALRLVRVDAGQFEQVVMNLVVNARDAMLQGGSLTVETRNVELDAHYAAAHIGVQPGPHVMVAVSDTGVGMTPEVQARLFEPFFTTKGVGTGTGLGLSTIYGIVKQSGGHIWVYSEVGAGSTFKVYLPVVEADDTVREPRVARPPVERGSEVVLLVEDDDMVRKLAQTVLQRHGYRVLVAQNGPEALLVGQQHRDKIDLLLTDVVMPKMSGRELADRLVPMNPAMKVLFMSGYTENAILHHGVLDEGVSFLQKPLTPDALLDKVREVLGGG